MRTSPWESGVRSGDRLSARLARDLDRRWTAATSAHGHPDLGSLSSSMSPSLSKDAVDTSEAQPTPLTPLSTEYRYREPA